MPVYQCALKKRCQTLADMGVAIVGEDNIVDLQPFQIKDRRAFLTIKRGADDLGGYQHFELEDSELRVLAFTLLLVIACRIKSQSRPCLSEALRVGGMKVGLK